MNLGNSFPNNAQSIISHPYLLYCNNPGYFAHGTTQINSRGYRGKEFEFEKKAKITRILCLGGSTTYGWVVNDPIDAWPAQLQKKLFPGGGGEVINAGLQYATSAEVLAGYVFRHRYLKPDIVIFHEGGNDVAAVLFPNYNPEYTHFRAHGDGVKLRRGERYLIKSNIFKVIYSIWLNNTETVYQGQPYSFNNLDPKDVLERVKNKSNYSGFYRNVDLLIRLIKNDNPKAEIYLFGFLKARKANISKKRPDLSGLEGAFILAVEKNNDILKNLSHIHNVTYINPEQTMFSDEWFLDHCHLNKEGQAKKAELVYETLLKKSQYLSGSKK